MKRRFLAAMCIAMLCVQMIPANAIAEQDASETVPTQQVFINEADPYAAMYDSDEMAARQLITQWSSL